jgi:hypothetical protein
MTFSDDYLVLLSNASATGSDQAWRGGRGTFIVEGTIGGATVTLQYSLDGTTWHDVGAEVTLSATGIGGFEIAPGLLRAEVSGGTPSALYVYAIGSRIS